MTNRLTRASAKCPCGAEVKPREGLRYVVGDNEYVWCNRCARTAHRRRMCLTRAAGSATIATGPRQTPGAPFCGSATRRLTTEADPFAPPTRLTARSGLSRTQSRRGFLHSGR